MPEIKNPNSGSGSAGGGQDNRSFMVMLVVMVGVLFGLQVWRAKHNPQTESPNTAAPAAQSASQSVAPAQPAQVAAGNPAVAAATPAVQAQAESLTVVENDVYRITFSNHGARVASWVLKSYKDSEGRPLDLVHDGASKLFGYPLSLYTYDAGLTQGLANALYVPSTTGTLQAPGTLSYEYAAGNVTVKKTFTFGADYVIHADAVVMRNGAPIRALISWPAGLGDMETLQAYATAQIDVSGNDKQDHIAAKKVSGGATLNGPFDFAGVSDQYFAAVFMPDQPQAATVATLHNEIDVNKVQRHTGLGQGAPAKGTALVPVLGTGVGSTSGETQLRLFVGPKRVGILKNIHTANGETLEPLLDFGFFGIIGKWLFLGLQAVHSVLAPAVSSAHDYSWGWAIILFTVLINLALLPLRVQSMRSGLKMQRLQPQMDVIKAKYKNPKPTDPKTAEMNAEIMALQKANGVSMFGGCVPTLFQLPLLFAFFTMMTRVVELRQAHWFWLHDLSAADPLFIKPLPIIMVLTSFLVQYYTPSPGVDPQQQKMMAFMMPAFSGYITWNYASGLALYWTVGNLIMIAQQAVMNRTSIGKEMREIAAKRLQRKAAAGTPKTIQGRR